MKSAQPLVQEQQQIRDERYYVDRPEVPASNDPYTPNPISASAFLGGYRDIYHYLNHIEHGDSALKAAINNHPHVLPTPERQRELARGFFDAFFNTEEVLGKTDAKGNSATAVRWILDNVYQPRDIEPKCWEILVSATRRLITVSSKINLPQQVESIAIQLELPRIPSWYTQLTVGGSRSVQDSRESYRIYREPPKGIYFIFQPYCAPLQLTKLQESKAACKSCMHPGSTTSLAAGSQAFAGVGDAMEKEECVLTYVIDER